MPELSATVPPCLSDLAERLTGRDASEQENGSPMSDPSVLVLATPATPPAAHDLSLPDARRAFLARASTLSLALPGIGAALAACAPGSSRGGDSTGARGTTGGAAGSAQDSLRHHNSDSKLDTTVLKGGRGGNSSATPGATSGADSVQYHRYDPALPALSAERTLQLNWRAMEAPIQIRPDTVVAAWTFEGASPARSSIAVSATPSSSHSRTKASSRTRWISTRRRSTRKSRFARS
jgi:hypothetical protein